MDKLAKELELQEKNHATVIKRLEREKDTFITAGMARHQPILFFIQACILPRCLYTNTDALYCAKYVH